MLGINDCFSALLIAQALQHVALRQYWFSCGSSAVVREGNVVFCSCPQVTKEVSSTLSCISTLPCSPSQCCSYFCFPAICLTTESKNYFFLLYAKAWIWWGWNHVPTCPQKVFSFCWSNSKCSCPSCSVCQGLTKSCWERRSLTQNICLVLAVASLSGSCPCRQWPSLSVCIETASCSEGTNSHFFGLLSCLQTRMSSGSVCCPQRCWGSQKTCWRIQRATCERAPWLRWDTWPSLLALLQSHLSQAVNITKR